MSRNYIEPDRQSAVSSFYRGRKDSFDALGGAADPSPRERGDDQSSFFQQGGQNRLSRGSNEMLGSAGYNRNSYFDPGRSMPVRGGRDEEEDIGFTHGAPIHTGYHHVEPAQDEGWDVYNDFNNTGPRYSEAFGTGLPKFGAAETGYHQLPPESGSVNGKSERDAQSLAPNVELVTVPALGPDWKKSEIENMRSATHREARNEERKRKFKAWWRDQAGCCGGVLTRKTFVAILFVVCCIIGIILAVTIPRVPGFSFDSTNPLTAHNATDSEGNQIPSAFSRVPANFSFPALLNIQVDTNSNIIPLHIRHIDAEVFSLDTNNPVADGIFGSITIPAKKFHVVNIPVVFNYTGVNDTDSTWLDFYNACKNHALYVDGIRPGFNLRVVLTTSITGLIKKVVSSTSISKVNCPIELPQNSV